MTMADPKDIQAHRRRAARVMVVPALIVAGAAAFFSAAMPLAILERLSRMSGLPLIFPPAAPPLGTIARIVFGTLVTVLLGIATWGFLFGIEYRLGPVKRRRRAVQVPVRPIRPAELDEVLRSIEVASPTADPEPLDLTEWQVPEAEPETVDFVELSSAPTAPEFSFAAFRTTQAAPPASDETRDHDESIARLMARLEEKIALREPDEPHPAMHPEGPFRAQLEELKRLATRR